MSQSVVFFADTKVDQNRNLFDKLEELFEKTIGPTISEGERICLKTHFGKFGNMAYMRPAIIRKMVDLLKAKGAIVALGETCGIGFSREGPFGGRTSATDYYENAAMNGYSIGTMNAPLILLDGEIGADTYDYDIEDGELLKTAQDNCVQPCKGAPWNWISGSHKELRHWNGGQIWQSKLSH
jgi:uncharacterized Fe-S center protein